MTAPTLNRALTLPLLTLYGLGVTVGAGIYVLVGATAARAGLHAPVSFLIAAIVVCFTALSYAELSTRYPLSAGEAAYVEAGFAQKHLPLVVGVLVMLSGIVSTGAVVIGTVEYVSQFIPLPSFLLTFFIIGAIALLALWGIFESVFLASLVTVTEIFGLLLVVYVGSVQAMDTGMVAQMYAPPFEIAAWTGILSGGLLAFFAFVGFEDMANVAEEVREPNKTLPRAIILTLLISTGLYLSVVTVVLVNVPLDQLSGSAAPLTFLFTGKFEFLGAPFGVIAILATFNGALIQVIMASRVLYGLASRGHLPAALSAINAVTRTPILATLVVAGVALALALWFPIEELAASTSLIVLVVFFVVNIALIRIKRQTRGTEDTTGLFLVPVWVPALGALFSLTLALTRIL